MLITELHAYGFVIKDFVIKGAGALFVPDPIYCVKLASGHKTGGGYDTLGGVTCAKA